ncbi:DEAD/DEAH box helicase [Candidatus Uabimicrobium amorphum]|uniref:Helicase HelZ n=1 Tax=Uabimicrobium amorphum TaxID=2596890 RepID=A0A5S9ILX6_UABAM|nr:DEAD/DEAH box helicase [Candidatus Uabimicrobium amorphum]BBM84144.1 helicase HelZ [Candidatus Uabimicrobium amorphum]
MTNSQLDAVILCDGSIALEWITSSGVVDKNAQKLQQQIYTVFQKNVAQALISLGFSDENTSLSPSLEFWKSFAHTFTKKLIQTPDLETIRDKVNIELLPQEIGYLLRTAPFMIGYEYLHEDLLRSLWSQLNKELQKEIRKHKGTVAALIKSYEPDAHLLGRVYFHLVENPHSSDYPFAFLATYSTRLANESKSKHIPLKFALKEYAHSDRDMLQLLATIETAAEKSALVHGLLQSGEIFHPLGWKANEALTFLREVAIYEQSGILCRIPNWWRKSSAGIQLGIKVGSSTPSRVGMASLLSFNVQLLLDGKVISASEARKILEESQGLAYLKGKWIEVNHEKLQKILSVFEKAQQVTKNNGMTLQEALHIQLGIKKFFGITTYDNILTIENGQWLDSVVTKLQKPESIQTTCPGRNFKATLRGYQQHGLNWLHFLHSLQFGACLADDMGLGKTIQIIAFINSIKSTENKKAHLLVVPASLLANWQNEIERFAPSLTYFIAHSSSNADVNKTTKSADFLNSYDIVITTYALVQRYPWLQNHSWQYVILDEAQAIKNPGTKQTKAVKKLKCYNRIALTGTPIENKLGDLWSLYDFINPGLLGSIGEFTSFAKELKSEGYTRLKKIISPYLLRRLKTDKSIISDLPDKIEMKVYASLSKKQILLYKQLVGGLAKAIKKAEGKHRRGIILGSLIKFKQLCNHPGQYLDNGDYAEKDSGKFAQLNEICQTIHAKREKVLVFTQFKEIAPALHDFLTTVFGREGLILHGGTAVKKRKSLIERFQSSEYVPFFILSVKAAGVGLNLTAANHVIHFDRWWNPAVENQATDRAFRIGQKKKVVVHKFITKGTIEEKIDAMLEDKLSLSQKIIESSGENWISQMDDQQMLDMFKLRL